MHLLAAQAGALQQEGEAIDLGQTPGPMAFASAADSELALMAAAADRRGETGLRLASTLRLAHNFSVDLWLDNTLGAARIIVLRLLGGAAYWPYGTDQIEALARARGIGLAMLPGDGAPDPALLARSTLHADDWHALNAILAEGGPTNADLALEAMARLAAAGGRSAAPVLAGLTPRAAPRCGLWWPDRGVVSPDALLARGEEAGATVPVLFYRAALEGAGTATVAALIAALGAAGHRPVPVFVSSLRAAQDVDFLRALLARLRPPVICNLTGFALGLDGLSDAANPFAGCDAPVIQLVQAGRPQAQWRADSQGLTGKDLAMQIVLPELDGRVGGILVGHKQEGVWHPATQCPLSAYVPDPDGIAQAARLVTGYVRLRATPRAERRVGMVLANYPIRDGRLANGVGYDAPQSSVAILRALEAAGYAVDGLADGFDGNALIARLQAGPTNADPARGESALRLERSAYEAGFAALPEPMRRAVLDRWGPPQSDPFLRADGCFNLPGLRLGNVAVLLQPARGYDRDLEANYHDPDLVPPHAYFAAYFWLRDAFGAHALIHNGKHGTLEWLPGKATALGPESYPQTLWGQLPHFYPFIVNDPGEGTQAKRRTGATIIDHLVPPLSRADTYGPLKDLEALLDEYYAASGMDRRRLDGLRRRILEFTRDARLDLDMGLPDDEDAALAVIDTYLCDLKEAQIRDGLHVFGASPEGALARDLLVALTRVPRGDGVGGNASLIAALADDLKLGADPLALALGAPWTGPRPAALEDGTPWRHCGDTIERLETLAAALVEGRAPEPDWTATRAVLAAIKTEIRPALEACGPREIAALIEGLDGRFVAPGPAGAPSRGRLDTLPTGRNFYSLDNRALPTPTAWALGQKSAESLVLRHFQDHGAYLRAVALSVWGTANMRTGGDDIAQALALIGAKPRWQGAQGQVTGYEIVPLARLGRPRVDVTLRISGFFRDAFPAQIALFDKAVRAIGALDEPEADNPIAARMRADALALMAEGQDEAEAGFAAGHRIFGSKPGAYGAGLQGLMDSGQWHDTGDLARAFLAWGQYAYGAHAAGIPERDRLKARLSDIEAVLHNQDNREHDLLDSDDYYQFEGGLIATAEALTGRRPQAYHMDHSRPDRPTVRTLEQEIARVMRSRVVNPKWIAGVKRHGYKGAFEIIATVDYMFAFAATTGAVKPHHFDLAFAAFVEDAATRDFLQDNNRFGYDELIGKFNEAIARGLWTPRSNSAYGYLSSSRSTPEG